MACVAAAFAAAIVAVSAAAGGGSAEGHAEPPRARDFTVPVLGAPGRHLTLSRQYAGKPVIVNFWASWCSPCQRETPLLARWHRRHAAVSLVGLDENDGASSALRFARARGVTYALAADPGSGVAQAYGVAGAGIPQTFFLDARHRVVDHVYGALTSADLARGLRLMSG